MVLVVVVVFFFFFKQKTAYEIVSRDWSSDVCFRSREHGLTAEQAYILASVAVDLRVGQVVDVPNYVITAVLNEGVFDE